MMAEWLVENVLLDYREHLLNCLADTVTFVFIKGARSQFFKVILATYKITFKLKETWK